MFGIGMTELLIVLVIVVVLFGASRLPKLGESLAETMKTLRETFKEPDEIDVTPPREERKPTDDEDDRPH